MIGNNLTISELFRDQVEKISEYKILFKTNLDYDMSFRIFCTLIMTANIPLIIITDKIKPQRQCLVQSFC